MWRTMAFVARKFMLPVIAIGIIGMLTWTDVNLVQGPTWAKSLYLFAGAVAYGLFLAAYSDD